MARPSVLVVFVVCVLTATSAAGADRGVELLRAGFAGTSLDADRTLVPVEERSDAAGNVFLRYEVRVRGVPVHGAARTVAFPAAPLRDEALPRLRGLTAEERRDLAELADVDLAPVVTGHAARVAAIRALRAHGEAGAVPARGSGEPEPALVLHRVGGSWRLVWLVRAVARVRGVATSADLFVDARSGEVVDRALGLFAAVGTGLALGATEPTSFPVEPKGALGFWLRDPERSVELYVPGASPLDELRPCTDQDGSWTREGPGRPDNQRAEVSAYANFRRLVDFWRDRFQFTWYQGNVPVKACVHYRDGDEDYSNAFYNGWDGLFYFGDGTGSAGGYDFFTRSLDVAGHEFMHGVLAQRCPLTYSFESGTINEHVADVGGSWLDPDDWRIGEDLVVHDENAMRDMADPTRGHAELLRPGMTYDEWWALHEGSTFAVYPDRLSLRIVCSSVWEDAGGVHLNSGILNRFYYLAVTGDGLGSPGLGRDRMAALYWRLIRDRLLPEACNFVEFRDLLLAAAALEVQAEPGAGAFLATLRAAFAAVELGAPGLR